jgi:hypothetical protein
MISLRRIILSEGRWTSNTEPAHFSASRKPTPFVPSELPDQKNLYLESLPLIHRTCLRESDGESEPFHLVSCIKARSSLRLLVVSTTSALLPLMVPTFMLPVLKRTSAFFVFFLLSSPLIKLDEDRGRRRLRRLQPGPLPAASRLLALAPTFLL